MAEERIQKILARAGLGARRKCETLIEAGRVSVNGKTAGIGDKADSAKDAIEVDGKSINSPGKMIYLALNKPPGYLTAAQDMRGRNIVMELVATAPCRVFPVGRLDLDTSGLLLFTNDGAFGESVLHPSRKILKTYEALVRGVPKEPDLRRLREGMELEDGPTAPAKAKILRVLPPKPTTRGERAPTEARAVIEIRIHEGRKRQVKRMFRELGFHVVQLRRVRIGGLELGTLPEGKWRYLTEEDKRKIFS